LRYVKCSLGTFAVTALAVAGLGAAGSASAATQSITQSITQSATQSITQSAPQAKVAWEKAIAHVRVPGRGCYHASYPALAWHAVKCVTAPTVPFNPAPAVKSARKAGPEGVGYGNDYSARVPGLISEATGTFQNVSPGITEKGVVGLGFAVAQNSFSLQLDTQYFKDVPGCSNSGGAACTAWQQFVYFYQGKTTSDIFMQYWLLFYPSDVCPKGWSRSYDSCYRNSSAAKVSTLTASELASLQFSGSAASGGDDAVSLSAGSGQATAVTASDSVLDLAAHWNTTEWGVFGDGGGDEAVFGADTSLAAQTAFTASSGSSAPKCVAENFTSETNNLKLTATPALGSESSPTMASEQTNGTSGTKSCAVG
jgi:hypothetical protein